MSRPRTAAPPTVDGIDSTEHEIVHTVTRVSHKAARCQDRRDTSGDKQAHGVGTEDDLVKNWGAGARAKRNASVVVREGAVRHRQGSAVQG